METVLSTVDAGPGALKVLIPRCREPGSNFFIFFLCFFFSTKEVTVVWVDMMMRLCEPELQRAD